MTHTQQVADLIKVAPPVTITSMSLAGYQMSDWVLLLTALYTLLQICLLLRRLMVSRRADDPPECAECTKRSK